MLLEEHLHEVVGTSYTEAQASGFEVFPDDVVIKNFLKRREATDLFDVKAFSVSLCKSMRVHMTVGCAVLVMSFQVVYRICL